MMNDGGRPDWRPHRIKGDRWGLGEQPERPVKIFYHEFGDWRGGIGGEAKDTTGDDDVP